MNTFLMPPPRHRGWSNSGVPAANCLLYTYDAGTTNPRVAYQDAAGTIPHENPIQLDAKGEALIYWDGNYKVDLRTASGAQITGYPVDNFETPVMASVLSGASGGGLIGFQYAATYGTGTVGKWLKDLALGTGATFMGFAQSLAGAKVRTMQDKVRESSISITDFSTIVADGTDQTAVIVAWLGTLGASYTGVIEIPYGVKFNATTVYAAIPPRALVKDNSVINIANASGYFPRFTGLITNCDSANTDSTFCVSDSHNANITIENRGTAPTGSAANRVAAWLWGTGRFQRGQPGMRSLGRAEFANISGLNKWSWVIRRYLPWAALNAEYWTASTVIAAGSYIISSPERIYMTVAGGTTGAVAPTHTSGTAVDGTVTWTFVTGQTDAVCFGVNENGELATNIAPTQSVVAYLKSNPDSGGTAIVIVEACTANQRADLRLQPTNASGAAITALPRLSAIEDSTLRLRTSGLNDLLIADETSMQFGANGLTEKQATLNSATPSVANCGLLYFANSAATSVTGFTGAASSQLICCWAENANTTFIHNAGSFILRGGVNVTPTLNQIIWFQKYSRSGAWVEIHRNF